MAAAGAPPARISRRSLFRATTVIVGGLASILGWGVPRGEAAAAKKIAQALAKYQDTPKGSQHCAICTHFEPPSSCQLVAGKISPQGWCILFGPKAPS